MWFITALCHLPRGLELGKGSGYCILYTVADIDVKCKFNFVALHVLVVFSSLFGFYVQVGILKLATIIDAKILRFSVCSAVCE